MTFKLPVAHRPERRRSESRVSLADSESELVDDSLTVTQSGESDLDSTVHLGPGSALGPRPLTPAPVPAATVTEPHAARLSGRGPPGSESGRCQWRPASPATGGPSPASPTAPDVAPSQMTVTGRLRAESDLDSTVH